MKKSRWILLCTVLLVFSVIASACGGKKTAKQYTVTFDYNIEGVVNVTSQIVEENKAIENFTPTRTDGYVFDAWYLTGDGTGEAYDVTAPVTSDLLLYAKWKKSDPKSYTLHFDLNGASGAQEDLTVAEGSEVTLPECTAKKTGQKFTGWSIAGQTYQAGDTFVMPSQNTGVIATWGTAYTISFELAGGTGTAPELGEFVRNETFVFPGSDGFSNGDKKFIGWSNGGPTTYKPGTQFKVSGNAVFTAVWGGIYTVSFDLAGGTGIAVPPATQYETEDIVTLPAGTPTKIVGEDIYLFQGWTDGSNLYEQGGEYVMGGSDVVFTAEWELGYSVNFVYNYYGEENTPFGDEAVVDYETKLAAPSADPEREDHFFIGWFKDKDCTLEWNFRIDRVRANTTLYAKWEHRYLVFKNSSKVPGKLEVEGKSGALFPENLFLPFSYNGVDVVGVSYGRSSTIGAFWIMQTVNSKPENQVKHIVIPNTYQYLGNGAFSANYWVQDITFADAENYARLQREAEAKDYSSFGGVLGAEQYLTEIGQKAFNGLKEVRQFDIPYSVKSIEREAFLYNDQMISVDLSKTQITELAPWLFARSPKLTTVLIPETCLKFGEAVFNCCESIQFEIPEGVTDIPDHFLSGGNVPDVINSLDDIQKGNITPDWRDLSTTRPCNMLQTKITLPSTVKEIGIGAFAFMDNLAEIEFAEGSAVEKIWNLAFTGCKGLKSFALPDSVNYLGHYAFRNSGLTEFTSGKDTGILETVGMRVFEGCTDMVSCTLPDSVKTILSMAFSNCTSLETFVMPEHCETLGDAFVKVGIASITLNEGLKRMAGSVFSDCDNLISVEIPSTVTETGLFMFSNCDNLQSVTFAEGAQLDHLSPWFLYECPKVTYFEFPANLSTFNYTADASIDYSVDVFHGCLGLKEIYLDPANPNYKVVNKTQLYTKDTKTDEEKTFVLVIPGAEDPVLVIEEGTKVIAPYAAYTCLNLKEVYIPNTVTTIRYSAFRFCKNLEKVVFQKDSQLTLLENTVFSNCNQFPLKENGSLQSEDYTMDPISTNLKLVVLPAAVPPKAPTGTPTFLFSDYSPEFTIMVPADSLEEYRRKEGWGIDVDRYNNKSNLYADKIVAIPDDYDYTAGGKFPA